jgi:hypothetical protein|tara:strand:+ start:1371 stop:1523 length:153 start_codon:yes stop_codon:yes gene_type:complete
MKEYIVHFTLSDGSKDFVTLKTDNIEYSLEQFERNRDVMSFDSVSLKQSL